MRQWSAPTLALLLALFAGSAQADAAAEARAHGQVAGTSIRGGLSETPAREMTPGYTATPPEAAIAPSELANTTAARIANCAQSTDPGCQAINTGRSDATVRANQPSMRGDATVQAAIDVTRNPVLDGIAAGYSACTPQSTPAGTVVRDVQYCHNYFLRVLDQPCDKVRKIEVTWSCAAGAEGPTLRADGSGYYCVRKVPTCKTGETLEAGVCVSGSQTRDPDLVPVEEEAIPEIREWWDNACAENESRVPPGMLPPDGVAGPIGAGAATGRLDKCERASTICSDPSPQTRVFNTLPVTRLCWQYTNTFNCVNLDPRSDCGQPRYGQCTAQGAPTCSDWDAFDPGFCTAQTQAFDCITSDTRRTETVMNCAGQTYSDRQGQAWDTAYPPNNDFLSVVAFMEAGREAGRYMTPGTGMQIFRGFDNRCRKKLFGLVNCCNKSGGPASAFNNFSVVMGAGSSVANAALSTYTYDALFASNAPDFLLAGFEALAGTGTTSALAGLLAGSVSVEAFLSTLVPGPWTIAMMAIQFSGLLSCEKEEQELAMKRDASLCVEMGTYCSRKLPIIRTCIERTTSHCCFNSRLAKLVHVQGKAQLGRGMGGAENPDCSGFTAEELQRIDLSRMDLAEFMDEIRTAAVDAAATVGRTDPMRCYYGAGKC